MNTQSAGKPRLAIMGARANTTNEQIFNDNAAALRDNHMFYVAPATADLTTGGVTFLGDGSSIAAAIAGMHSKPDLDAGAPLEREDITAFDNITDPFTLTQKTRMAESNGVLVITKKNGSPRMFHFVSTGDPVDILLQEGKVARIEIDIRRGLQKMLDSALINTRFVNGQTISTAKSLVGEFLKEKIRKEIITQFTLDKVAKSPTDARQLDIEISVVPVFNVNFINIPITFRAQ